MAEQERDVHPPARPKGPTSSWVASAIGILGVTLFTVLLWMGKIASRPYVGLLALLAALCVYISGPNAWWLARRPAPAGPEDTPRAIAFHLLVFFGVALS